MSRFIYYFLAPLRVIYRAPPESVVDLRKSAKNDIVINSKAGIRVAFRPPSDMASAFRGAVAFLISATADIVGTVMDRKKMTKWFECLTEFKAYLDLSGVGDELEEAIYKPLMCGRLLDNIKILNDCQELMYADRCQGICECSADEVKDDLVMGKRYVCVSASGG